MLFDIFFYITDNFYMSILIPEDITKNLSLIISKNKIWAEKNVFLYIIANQTAGCFKHAQKATNLKKILEDTSAKVMNLPDQTTTVTAKTLTTEYAGHGKELAQGILAELLAIHTPNASHIIVTAGGDGTSLEVQTALLMASFDSEKKRNALLNDVTLIRLPMGTGNDGTDGHHLSETMKLLTGKLKFSTAHAIKVYPEGNGTDEDLKRAKKNPFKYSDNKKIPAPWYSFNTASMGIDSFVCYMTNAIKRKMPGNIYQACVILSAFVYDKVFKTGHAIVEAYDANDKKIGEYEDSVTFIAFGKQGHTTYGGGHLIFPDERNVCFTRHVSLPKLVTINKGYCDGTYITNKHCTCSKAFSADKIRIHYDQPILIQCDGETVMVAKEHFPIIMEKTAPFVRIVVAEE